MKLKDVKYYSNQNMWSLACLHVFNFLDDIMSMERTRVLYIRII